jgi:nicotinate-nucleotide adenylyltransferase
MGRQFKILHKWKNYEAILKHHDIYVYPLEAKAEQAKQSHRGKLRF